MKNLITLILFSLVTTATWGQDLLVNSYVEQTNVGPKVGTSIGVGTNFKFEFGGFYQKAVDVNAPETTPSWTIEQEFYGAYFNYAIAESNHFGLQFNVRTGVSNGQNFVITPSLLGSVSPIKTVKLGAGLGVRAFQPTLMGSISIRLGNNKGTGYIASK
ncbi:hypothetical protein [Marinoscillum sp.]|uniref:hypothetical protein n=1 Tax=Marinoscillum sp. TaxID=2024838 RepID=UPI003BAB74CD